MELRLLQYFLMVAREGTISQAAQVLHVSQPSLSRQLKKLEMDLGCTLFTSGSKHIELTEAGLRLREQAEELLEMADRIETDFHTTPGTLAGKVRIGGGETPAMALIADVIAELHSTYPLLRFSLFSGNGFDVSERLDAGRIDFGLFIGNFDTKKYESLPLPAQDTWGAFMPADDPLADKTEITPEDLLDKPLVCSIQDLPELPLWFKRDVSDLKIVATYNLLYNASLLAKRGIGYVISLKGIIDTSQESGLVFRPFKPARLAPIYVAWKRYQTFSPAANVFLSTIREKWG